MANKIGRWVPVQRVFVPKVECWVGGTFRWEEVKNIDDATGMQCSVCGCVLYISEVGKHCPICKANMA